MTQEEKAKAYDEALERARDFMNGEVPYALERGENIICWIFPELVESENEKIRKELIEFVKTRLAGFPQCDKYLAWLEKQDEHKPFDYENANIQQKDFAPKSAMEAIKEEKIDNANKVEPKDYSSIDPHFFKTTN